MAKIQLTPSELQSQSQEMSALMSEYESVFSKTNTLLTTVNNNWSANLANNFAAKMVSSQKAFNQIVSMLSVGSELAATSATTFESVDSLLAQSTWQDAVAEVASIAGTSSVAMNESTSDTSDKSFWERLWENGVEVWNETWETLPEAWEVTGEFIEALCENYENLPDWTKELFKKALHYSGLEDYSSTWEVVKDIITGDVDWDTGETVIKAITKGTKYSLVGNVWSYMSDNWEAILGWVEPSTELADEVLNNGLVLTGLADFAGAAYGIVGGAACTCLDVVCGAINKVPIIGPILKDLGVTDTIVTYTSDSVNTRASWIFDGVEKLADAEKEVKEVIDTVKDEVVDAVVDTAKETVGAIVDVAEDAGEAIAEGVSKVGKWFSGLWS